MLRIIEADAADMRRHLASSRYSSSDLDGRTGRDVDGGSVTIVSPPTRGSYLSFRTLRIGIDSTVHAGDCLAPTDDRGSRAQGVLECLFIWDI